jgi:general stress protein 26
MADHTQPQDSVRKIAELIKDIDFGMLTTTDAQGRLNSRPMSSNKKVEFDGDVWFFTYGETPKVHEIERRPYVNVAFSDPKTQTYVSLSGRAELVRDKAKMAELWEPALKAWFPKGLDEPDIALLKVNADQAEYWDSPSSPVAHLISLAKAAVTGQPAQPGENEKVSL